MKASAALRAFVLVLVLAACTCPPKASTTPSPDMGSEPAAPGASGGPSGSAATSSNGSAAAPPSQPPPPAGPPAPGIGENCGPTDGCAAGLTCVAYYGVAGARGPQFKTCEIKCTNDRACPADHKCTTIADGPGQVCRK